MCVSPVLLPTGLSVPCGKCPLCLSARKQMWTIRLRHHKEYHPDAHFLTLTYAPKNLNRIYVAHKVRPLRLSSTRVIYPIERVVRYVPTGVLCHRDVQLFLKRLRKRFPTRKIQYYMCGEYGPKTDRPHYHLILYGLRTSDYGYYWVPSVRRSASRLIDSLWSKGYNTIGACTPKSIAYCAGYVQKKLFGKRYYADRPAPYARMSHGLGLQYALDHASELRSRLYCRDGKFKIPLPRYYRDKLDITAVDYVPFRTQTLKDEIDQYKQEHLGRSPHSFTNLESLPRLAGDEPLPDDLRGEEEHPHEMRCIIPDGDLLRTMMPTSVRTNYVFSRHFLSWRKKNVEARCAEQKAKIARWKCQL